MIKEKSTEEYFENRKKDMRDFIAGLGLSLMFIIILGSLI
jgi:hypothetical protein